MKVSMCTAKESFVFSVDRSERFRCIGMDLIQDTNGIDQGHYMKTLELPDIDFAKRSYRVTTY